MHLLRKGMQSIGTRRLRNLRGSYRSTMLTQLPLETLVVCFLFGEETQGVGSPHHCLFSRERKPSIDNIPSLLLNRYNTKSATIDNTIVVV